MDQKRNAGHDGVAPSRYPSLADYQKRSWKSGAFQLLNTVVPYITLFGAMLFVFTQGWPFWSVLLLAMPAALFMVRTFIIFHDCTHESFLPSKLGNRIVGFITGVLAFTPYETWRLSHLRHHATNGQLDHRGTGDIYTMTVDEYREASPLQRAKYRLYRNPFVLLVFGPAIIFLIVYRFAGLNRTAAERRSVLMTDVAIAGIATAVSLAFGWRAYLAVQLPIQVLCGAAGVWLFYIQHQCYPGYWAHDESWNRFDAALIGSSLYKLPSVLRWFTGNIGYHHIHHLQPRIPNYQLRPAYLAIQDEQGKKPLTFWRSLRFAKIKLWSELQQELLSFRQALRLIRET